MKVLAGSALLRSLEKVEIIVRHFSHYYILSCLHNSSVRGCVTSQNPDVLSLEDEEGLCARIDDRVICVISVKDAIISIIKQEEANSALSTFAISRALDVVNFTLIVLRVVNNNPSVFSQGVFGLLAVTKFECDASVSDLFVPNSKIFVDIEVFLKCWFRTETEAEHCICSSNERKSCNCCRKEKIRKLCHECFSLFLILLMSEIPMPIRILKLIKL